MGKQWTVYVTRMIPQEVLDELAQHCEVEVNPENRPLTKAELLEKVRGRDAVLTQAGDIVDDAVLAAAGPQCKIFANYAVGYNNFDLAAARALSTMRVMKSLGIEESRTIVAAFGQYKPRVPNRTPEGTPLPVNQALNRRVSVHVVPH